MVAYALVLDKIKNLILVATKQDAQKAVQPVLSL
jgi:hypothetical protein